MPQPKPILKMRVDQKCIKEFPFDLVYMVPQECKEVLPSLFPWSLCFTITNQLSDLLEKVQESHKGKGVHYPARGRPSPQEVVFTDPTNYFLVVPIMGLEQRRFKPKAPRGSKVPAYLVAKRHRLDATYAHLFTPDTVLFTPDGPVRPICRACPRVMLQMQGYCQLGSPHCYHNLVMKKGPEDVEVSDE